MVLISFVSGLGFSERSPHGICSPHLLSSLSVSLRVLELQGSIDMTMGAFDVVGTAMALLDDTTMSMKWEVFGWPQKVHNESLSLFQCLWLYEVSFTFVYCMAFSERFRYHMKTDEAIRL